MNPWLIIGVILAIGAAAGGGYYKGNEDGRMAIQSQWDAERIKQQEAYARALQEAAEKQQTLQAGADILHGMCLHDRACTDWSPVVLLVREVSDSCFACSRPSWLPRPGIPPAPRRACRYGQQLQARPAHPLRAVHGHREQDLV